MQIDPAGAGGPHRLEGFRESLHLPSVDLVALVWESHGSSKRPYLVKGPDNDAVRGFEPSVLFVASDLTFALSLTAGLNTSAQKVALEIILHVLSKKSGSSCGSKPGIQVHASACSAFTCSQRTAG